MTNKADLLFIDTESAVNKLCQQKYKSDADAVLSIIKAAAFFSPSAINITLKRGLLTVETTDGIISSDLFKYAALFSSNAADSVRLEALDYLEKEPGSFIIAVFSRAYKKIIIEWQSNDISQGLIFFPKKEPHSYTSPSRKGLKISIRGLLGNTAIIGRLKDRCRFSLIPITINGRNVSKGLRLPACLIQKRFSLGSLTGAIGIPQEGELSSLVILEYGIASDEVFLNEISGLVLKIAVSGVARDCEHYEVYRALREIGRKMYTESSAMFNSFPSELAPLFKKRLMKRYEHSRESKLLKDIPLFKTVSGNTVDLREITEQSRNGEVFVLDNAENISEFITDNRFVLIVDSTEKDFLYKVLNLSLKTPPIRTKLCSIGYCYKKLRRRLQQILFLHELKEIDEAQLTEDELQFLNLIRKHVGDKINVKFCRSAITMPPQKYKNSCNFWIPRKHPTIKKIIHKTVRMPELVDSAVCFLSQGKML